MQAQGARQPLGVLLPLRLAEPRWLTWPLTGRRARSSSWASGGLLPPHLIIGSPPSAPPPCAAPQGAIIIVGVMGLLDYPEFIYLWRTNKFDWLVWNVAFLFTIFLVRRPAGPGREAFRALEGLARGHALCGPCGVAFTETSKLSGAWRGWHERE